MKAAAAFQWLRTPKRKARSVRCRAGEFHPRTDKNQNSRHFPMNGERPCWLPCAGRSVCVTPLRCVNQGDEVRGGTKTALLIFSLAGRGSGSMGELSNRKTLAAGSLPSFSSASLTAWAAAGSRSLSGQTNRSSISVRRMP